MSVRQHRRGQRNGTLAESARTPLSPSPGSPARGISPDRADDFHQEPEATGAHPAPFAYDPAHGITDHGIMVDDEFRRLPPPRTPVERAELEQQLPSDGICLQPLVVWKGPHLLLDGYTRLEYCTRWQIPFRQVAIDLPDRLGAKAWILDHQAGRRNLTGAGWSVVRGRHYLLEKQPHGGRRRGPGTSCQIGNLKMEERLA
jgi:hypothetical protein